MRNAFRFSRPGGEEGFLIRMRLLCESLLFSLSNEMDFHSFPLLIDVPWNFIIFIKFKMFQWATNYKFSTSSLILNFVLNLLFFSEFVTEKTKSSLADQSLVSKQSSTFAPEACTEVNKERRCCLKKGRIGASARGTT